MTKVQLATRQIDFRVDDGRSGFLMLESFKVVPDETHLNKNMIASKPENVTYQSFVAKLKNLIPQLINLINTVKGGWSVAKYFAICINEVLLIGGLLCIDFSCFRRPFALHSQRYSKNVLKNKIFYLHIL